MTKGVVKKCSRMKTNLNAEDIWIKGNAWTRTTNVADPHSREYLLLHTWIAVRINIIPVIASARNADTLVAVAIVRGCIYTIFSIAYGISITMRKPKTISPYKQNQKRTIACWLLFAHKNYAKVETIFTESITICVLFDDYRFATMQQERIKKNTTKTQQQHVDFHMPLVSVHVSIWIDSVVRRCSELFSHCFKNNTFSNEIVRSHHLSAEFIFIFRSLVQTLVLWSSWYAFTWTLLNLAINRRSRDGKRGQGLLFVFPVVFFCLPRMHL